MLLLIFAWYIPLFNSEIYLNEDGSLKIVENITVDFNDGYYHGIYRDIPLELRGRVGNYSLGFNVEEVQMDGRDIPVKKSTRRPGGWTHLRLRIGDPDRTITGIHRYKIQYTVLLGARYFDKYDELYWNVTGNKWETVIDSSVCNVYFPEPVELSSDDIKIFYGVHGSRETINEYFLDREFISFSSGRIKPGSGITIDLRFPKGYLKKPSSLKAGFLWFKNNFGLFIPLVVLILFLVRWYKHGRDTSPGPIETRYSPPESITAAEAGTIFDQKVDTVDLTSILFDLARLGYIKIEEVETRFFLALKRKDYKIHIIKDIDMDLPDHFREFYHGLEDKGGREFLLSELKGEFYTYISDIKDSIYNSMKKKKYFFEDPEEVRKKYYIISFLLLFFGFQITVFGVPLMHIVGFLVKVGLGILISGIICLIFSRIMPRKTRKGTVKLREILGFREFLVRVEQERLKRMLDENPTIFYDFLPFAVSLGVIDEWAERFSGLEVQAPEWYVSPSITGTISAHQISSTLGDTISAISTSMSPPRGSSSGFSGGGGGGFSGGGGGGGGGGAW